MYSDVRFAIRNRALCIARAIGLLPNEREKPQIGPGVSRKHGAHGPVALAGEADAGCGVAQSADEERPEGHAIWDLDS